MPTKSIVIVPARLDSKRLPRKALINVAGHSIIEHVLNRAKLIPGASKIVCATTAREVDADLVEHVRRLGFDVYRGQTDDVAGRFLGCATSYDAEYFVRVNGDCVFADPELIGQGLALAVSDRPDMVTNLIGREFPYGIAVEVVATKSYAKLYEQMKSAQDKEHVTSYIYDNAVEWNIRSMRSSFPELKGARLVVDTHEDLVLFQKIATRMEQSKIPFGYGYVAAAKAFLDISREHS